MGYDLNAIRSVYDNAPYAFCVIRIVQDEKSIPYDFVFEYANASLADMEGFSETNLIGNSFNSLFKNVDNKWIKYMRILHLLERVRL